MTTATPNALAARLESLEALDAPASVIAGKVRALVPRGRGRMRSAASGSATLCTRS